MKRTPAAALLMACVASSALVACSGSVGSPSDPEGIDRSDAGACADAVAAATDGCDPHLPPPHGDAGAGKPPPYR